MGPPGFLGGPFALSVIVFKQVINAFPGNDESAISRSHELVRPQQFDYGLHLLQIIQSGALE